MEQSDLLQGILSNLKVNEIVQLCIVSSSFNLVCERESLWKDKLWSDYRMRGKQRDTWRETVKVVFQNSEKFWENLDKNIKYFMTIGISFFERSQLVNDVGKVKAKDLINRFERKLADHALREREEFYVVELIFKSFYLTDRFIDSMNDSHYINFIPLFKKTAELSIETTNLISSRGKLSSLVNLSTERKISLKWILNLNHIEDIKVKPIDVPVYFLGIELTDEIRYLKSNKDLYMSMASLAFLYKKHQDLFVDDTTDDQRDIVIMLNNWHIYWP